MSSTPPTTLGKYQIIREIARSNDIVYEAYDALMNRRVAVKELALPGGSSPQQKEDRVKRFLREARAAGSLAHPNIMTVFEVGQEGDRYFIAMEYLDGKTLRNEIDTKGFLSPERSVEIAIAILEGLEYAHSKGVIHRDIKPDNVQLLSSGAIKLTDFGIARLTFEPNLTMDGQVFGTPSYMSPEQVVGRDIDPRSDLFSVGVVLYEMLSGVKPFAGDSVVTITYGIMNKTPDRPQQINFSLWQVIERALDKSPQLRHKTARDFITALNDAMRATQAVQNTPPLQAPPQQTLYSPPQSLYSPSAYGSSNPAPAPVYQHNPYAPQPQMPVAQPQYSQQPVPPIMGPVSVPPTYGTSVPVYYPPPPRKPLIRISPQARKVIAQVFVYLVALGAMGGLIVVGLNAATTAISRIGEEAKPAPGANGKSAPRDVATDFNAQGIAAQNAGDLQKAEEAFIASIKASPKYANAYLNLGELLVTRASREGDPDARREYMRRAAESFAASATLEKPGYDQDHASVRGAESYFNLAQLYIEAGMNREARDQLYKARALAHSDQELSNQIENLNQRLSGYL